MACRLLCRENIKHFIDSFDTILADCDGVLWNGPTVIEGAAGTIQKLKQMGKRVFYVTNNSTKTRSEYVQKTTQLGFPSVQEDIIGSAYTTAQYLKHTLKLKGKVYIVGSTGISQELDAVGIPHIGVGPDPMPEDPSGIINGMQLDPEVTCVVVGMDFHFSYPKLARAIGHLQSKDCHFVVTNTDSGLPAGKGRVLPGTGSLVKAVETAAQRKADVICGKPHHPMFDFASQNFDIKPDRTMMIGDRLDTDILFAAECGLQSLFVLSGFSTLDDVRQMQASPNPEDRKHVPQHYTDSLEQLGDLITQENLIPNV